MNLYLRREHMSTAHVIEAEAKQQGGWWTAKVTSDDLPPVTAKSLSSVSSQIKKIAADLLDLSKDDVQVSITTELPGPVQQLVDKAAQHKETAKRENMAARTLTKEAAESLKNEGWTVRDIASRLNVSAKFITETANTGSDSVESKSETSPAQEESAV